MEEGKGFVSLGGVSDAMRATQNIVVLRWHIFWSVRPEVPFFSPVAAIIMLALLGVLLATNFRQITPSVKLGLLVGVFGLALPSKRISREPVALVI